MWSTAPLSELIERGRGHCCKFQCAYTEIDYYLIVCHDTFKLHGQPNIDLVVFTSGWFSGEMPYYFRKCGGNFGCSAMVSIWPKIHNQQFTFKWKWFWLAAGPTNRCGHTRQSIDSSVRYTNCHFFLYISLFLFPCFVFATQMLGNNVRMTAE